MNRSVLSSFAALVLLLAVGCGGDDDDACGEPGYGGVATDEAWRTMVDGEDGVGVGGDDAPVLTAPAEGAEVSAAGDALDIEWDSTLAVAPQPGPRVLRTASASPWLEGLGALFEGTAWAHLPPVTGDIYWVRVTVPGRACKVEGLTTDLFWQVTGVAWDAVREASGQTVSIEVTSAYLNENRITEGPYRPSRPRTVTIVP